MLGDAGITSGFALPSSHIIHTVGPQIRMEDVPYDAPDGYGEDPVLLARCYTRSLELCLLHGLRSIAFCWYAYLSQ
jgi:O-acetyl-ADP-ribose deacetylase (regulator of RNase III)